MKIIFLFISFLFIFPINSYSADVITTRLLVGSDYQDDNNNWRHIESSFSLDTGSCSSYTGVLSYGIPHVNLIYNDGSVRLIHEWHDFFDTSGCSSGDHKIFIDQWIASVSSEPDPCGDSGRDPIQDCGEENQIIWEDIDTCLYHCQICDDDYQEALAACGPGAFSISQTYTVGEGCDWICTNCDQAEAQQQSTDCPLGYEWIDHDLCTWKCIDKCSKSYTVCNQECYALGGVLLHRCTEDPPQSECICVNDDPQDPIEQPSDTPDQDPDPDTSPTPDPTDDETNKWLASIKHNTDTMIDQNDDQLSATNESNKYLENLDENTKKIVKNQDTINNSINGVKSSVDSVNNTLSGIDSSLSTIDSDLNTGFETLDTTLQDMKTDDPVPSVPDFDSSLDSSKNYSEFDDSTTLGTTTAQDYIQDLTTDDFPIDATVSASNISSCISGNITLHNHSQFLNICFNKPWMMTGYSVMRLIFIAVGYLQTAILLNRAIGN